MTMINEMTTGKGFIMVNKTLAKLVGLVPATIYGELLSTFLYWQQREQLTIIEGKEWFFCTIEDLEDKTTVKKDTQAKAIKTLEKAGLLEVKRHGLPAKRYFHITEKFNEMVFADYIAEKPQTDNSNVSNTQNSHEARSNQISQKPQTTLLNLRNQDFAFSDTNNKHINNKELIIKDSLANELAIANYQATDDKSSISVSKEKEMSLNPMLNEAFQNIETPPVLQPEEIKKNIEEQLQANKTLTDEKEAIELLTNAANELYTKFSIGRWNKKQWTNLITKFVMETITNNRHLTITRGSVKGYVYAAIKTMARNHDYKHSEEFKVYKEQMSGLKSEIKEELPNGMYNWLTERD